MSLIGGINLSGDAAREAMREVARASLRAEAKRESSQYQQAVQENHLNSFIRNLSQLRFRAKALDMQANFDKILSSNNVPDEVIKKVQDQSEIFQEGLESGAREHAPEEGAANAARARVVASTGETARADQARARGDGTPPDLQQQWRQLARGDTRGQATPTKSEPAPSAAAQASATRAPAEPTPPPPPATPPPTTPSATEIVTRMSMPGETQETLPTPRQPANVGSEGEPVKVAVPEQPAPVAESTRTLAKQEGPTQGGPLAEATPPPTAGETQPPGTVRIIRRGERKASEPPENAEAQLLTAGPTLRSMEAGLRPGTPTTARDAARLGAAAAAHQEGETIASLRRRTPSKGEPRGGASAASASRRGSALDPREVAVRLRSEPIRG